MKIPAVTSYQSQWDFLVFEMRRCIFHERELGLLRLWLEEGESPETRKGLSWIRKR